MAECPVCATRNTTPYQAIELVACAVSDRADLEAENERLRAALTEIADCPNEGPFLRRLAREATR